jgi:prepilin signal peptidase PulO-like enzyme (type II secretory pathway)
VSIETFQWVTGPKTDHLVTGRESDHWLVMTVGVLVSVIGLTLIIAAWRRHGPLEVVVLAMGSALGLTAIDVIYVSRNVLAPIYLADAALEVLLLLGWLTALILSRTSTAHQSKSLTAAPESAARFR